jgi:hypothetical protein
LLWIELFQKIHGRSRYWLHAVFPTIGVYALSIKVDEKVQLTVYVDNKCTNSAIPFLSYPVSDTGFIPLVPRAGLTEVTCGVAVIRFVAFAGQSTCSWKLVGPRKEPVKGRVSYCQMTVPFDVTRWETIAAVAFPEDGRWQVTLSLSDGKRSFRQFVTYEFDVSGAPTEVCSALDYVSAGRQFVPLQMATNLVVSPTASVILAGTRDVKVTVCYKGSLSLSCFPFGKGRRVPATKLREDVEGTQRTADYSLRLPSPGDYVISYFLNDRCEFRQLCRFGKDLNPADDQLSELRSIIDSSHEDPEFDDAKSTATTSSSLMSISWKTVTTENCEDVFSAFRERLLNCQGDASRLTRGLLRALKSASIVSLFSQTGIAEILPADENFLRIVRLMVIVDPNDLSERVITKVMACIPERLEDVLDVADLFARRFKRCRNPWPFFSHLRRRARMCDANGDVFVRIFLDLCRNSEVYRAARLSVCSTTIRHLAAHSRRVQTIRACYRFLGAFPGEQCDPDVLLRHLGTHGLARTVVNFMLELRSLRCSRAIWDAIVRRLKRGSADNPKAAQVIRRLAVEISDEGEHTE